MHKIREGQWEGGFSFILVPFRKGLRSISSLYLAAHEQALFQVNAGKLVLQNVISKCFLLLLPENLQVYLTASSELQMSPLPPTLIAELDITAFGNHQTESAPVSYSYQGRQAFAYVLLCHVSYAIGGYLTHKNKSDYA